MRNKQNSRKGINRYLLEVVLVQQRLGVVSTLSTTTKHTTALWVFIHFTYAYLIIYYCNVNLNL